MPDNLVQIPFSAFKLIDLGQSIALSVYQSLYTDHTEPVGLIATIQALGLLKPSEQAIDLFNQRWTRESMRWKVQETGIEVVTGKSSATGEMAKTRDGEATLLVVSFLIEALGAKSASNLTRSIIQATPSDLLPIRPRKSQVENVVNAIQSQTTCVSWQLEMSNAQECVAERPVVWVGDVLPPSSFDLPVDAMKAYYQALSLISAFPENYRCILRTPLSLTVAFALAHSICGLDVCVVVDGEVVHGNPAAEKWQVKLERYGSEIGKGPKTEVKWGQRLDVAQDLLVVDDVGPIRANRVSITGIGKTATISQGLGGTESKDIAALAIGAAASIMGRCQKELVDESGDRDAESVSLADSTASTAPTPQTQDDIHTVPLNSRVTINAIATWWGCSDKEAADLFEASQKAFSTSLDQVSWIQIPFSKKIMGTIAEFEDLDSDAKAILRSRINHARDRRDFSRLTHMLTTQLILICLLRFNTSTRDQVRVRSTCSPQNSEIGRAIKNLEKPEALHQSDIMYSWYFWLHGTAPRMPEGTYGVDALSVEGYLVYRNFLVDLDLSPEACEMVTVEPGHIRSQNERIVEVRGLNEGHTVYQVGHYRKILQARHKLRSQDRTGPVQISWTADEGDDSVDLGMRLKVKQSGVNITASVYQVIMLTWNLHYGDRLLGCQHDEDRVGVVLEGERVEVVSAGSLEESPQTSALSPLLLFGANRNMLGQIACLLSVPQNARGMLRRDACLRCCITACEKRGLDFLID